LVNPLNTEHKPGALVLSDASCWNDQRFIHEIPGRMKLDESRQPPPRPCCCWTRRHHGAADPRATL